MSSSSTDTFHFPANTADPTFFRTYSRLNPDGSRESWEQTTDRTTAGLVRLGDLTEAETQLIRSQQLMLHAMVSGRWLWVGGTWWIEQPENFSGGYNCTAFRMTSFERMAFMMSLGMMGCGTGTLLESETIEQLPPIACEIKLEIVGTPGELEQIETTTSVLSVEDGDLIVITIAVGDSRQGWVSAYLSLLELAAHTETPVCKVVLQLGHIRAAGAKIQGFGGVTNPIGLNQMFEQIVKILNGAVGRQLTSVEVCLILDEASKCVVAGNVRRGANMRQGASDDKAFAAAKDNLWLQREDESWYIDPDRDALRMGNHTRIFHYKPSLEDCIAAVSKQYYSGEGAIQWAGEAVARSNADLLTRPDLKAEFLRRYALDRKLARQYLYDFYIEEGRYMDEAELDHRMMRFLMNPCFAAGTMVLTRDGHFPIDSLVGKTVEIWDGNQWMPVDNFRVTGENQPVFSVRLQNGQEIEATDYHSFVLADGSRKMTKELLVGDRLLTHEVLVSSDHIEPAAYLKGFLVGDGSNAQGHARLDLYTPKAMCKTRLLDSASQLEIRELVAAGNGRFTAKSWGFTPSHNGREQMQGLAQVDLLKWSTTAKVSLPMDILNWSLESKCEFIAGVMDADGCALDKNGCKYQISSIQEEWIDGFQLLLKSIGIDSKQSPVRRGGTKDFGANRGGEYKTKDIYRLTIAQTGSIKLSALCEFARLRSFRDVVMQIPPKLQWNKVESVKFSHIADKVYCCTVNTNHQFSLTNGTTVGNCGEILGTDFSCNLSEVHLNLIDPYNLVEQNTAFRAAALSVSVLLNHKFVDAQQQYSRELDPIVGVSFTGLFDFFVHAFGVDWLKWWAAGRELDFQISADGWNKCCQVAELFEIEICKPMTDRDDDRFYHEGEIYRALESAYLNWWRTGVEDTVADYCDRHDLKTPNRCTTVQPSGCLDRTALRIFDQGLLYADEIVAEGSGETVGLDLSVRSGIAVNTAIANQPLNLVKVTLRNGRQLRMTTNHRMSIRGKWVEAVDLEPGMVIDYQIGCYQKLDEVKLIGINPENYTRALRAAEVGSNRGVIARTISTPSLMSPDLGYFLGALFGNGCFSPNKYRIRFAHEYISVLNRLSQIGRDLFGIAGNLHEDPRGGRSELCFASKQLFDWFHQNNIAKTVKSKDLDRIPEPIRRSSQNTLLSFFCGLIDTDGCIRKDGKLSIDSASENFIRNLQQVGESIGLSFGISHNTQGSNHQAVKSIWSLSLSRTKSTRSAIDYLNQHSTKAQLRPISFSTKTNGGELYAIVSVEPESVADYSYDFAVEGVNDDDAWYWQGGLKSHNTKSLLTGASPGWHPPKAVTFLRRMTFRRNDPVALACIDFGYTVIPSQSDKDEHGNLLDNPYDDRCTEWLVEIPVTVPWSDLPGVDSIDISQFSALAQMDFYMNIQVNYARHNVSATIELREDEITPLATRIYQSIQDDEGYMSAALLARFEDHQSFPRLPFEPIDKATYLELVAGVMRRRVSDNFGQLLAKYDRGDTSESGPAGCDSDKCLMPERKP
jgi:ribonucleotide reductase, class II